MNRVGSPKEIHLYDSVTGKYVKTYDSYAQLERENGFYRGAVSDILKSKVKPKILISKEKNDVHPSFLSNAPEPMVSEVIKPVKTHEGGLLSEAELRKKHDMFYQIFSFVKSIPEGKFVEETTMLRQLTLLGKPRYKEALAREDLKQFKGKVDGTIYYGNPNSIHKLKSEGVLQ